ncbi:SDR family NAD(P)-dependent oxidoreductase [Paracoccus sp. S-4012]|uniref:SDR family oxidoreductase n=1 Tax=Paracoccus sp. S-4012 TaxID=2665648 RepID=UPI0012B0CCC7|nr:SDR family oxidoreductase [Paracoccus sp. S-4012]MRX51139.1 SDR family NAD(P)-dependent oxidoreductase [Paracoccus sp. S-4012]
MPKTALVTGGGAGIGRTIAEALLARGHSVVAADLRFPDGVPEGARALVADVSTDAGVRAMIDDVEAREGPVDVFVGNAGLGFAMDAASPDEDWARMMDVNLMAHVRAARRLLPDLAHRGGSFVVTASAAGLLNEVGSIGYGVSKHAAVGFAEWLAFHHAADGLKVHCLCPEGVLTSMIGFAPYLRERAVTPEAVAAALMAAMDAGRFMVTTHESTLKGLAVKAADYDKFIRFMARETEKRRDEA